MSDSNSSGFGKFVPGFDFLQNLAQGAAGNSSLPNFGKWVAPTLDVEELDKRIEELKIVRFWLEQNSNALGATIQALEVQKMTLATLKGMNFNFGNTSGAKADTKADSKTAQASGKPGAKAGAEPTAGVIDPMQLWGSLTQQFQKIAESAVKDASGMAAQATQAAATSAASAASAAKAATKQSSAAGKRRAAAKRSA